MSRIAGMQPYFFPYIGYFQLINAVDLFVVYDDGHMIVNGFMHKNSILANGEADTQPVTLNTTKSPYKKIYEVELADNGRNFNKMLKTLRHVYSKAPYYSQVMPVIEKCLKYPERNLVKFLTHELHCVCDYIGITTRFVFSSEVSKEGLEHIEEKVFRICDHFGIHDLINPVGGKELYKKDYWAEHGVKLSFLHRNDGLCYEQFKEPFVKDLSIIDVMMFNSPPQIRELLTQYTLE